MPSVARRHLLVWSALLLPGCGELEALLGLDEDEDPSPTAPAPVGDVPAAEPDPLSAPPEPLVRSDRKLRFPGKSGEHMGFDLDRLAKLHALAGAVELPEWSSPGEGNERDTRDDDLRTAWRCRLPDGGAEEGGPTCALGIHFPVPAEVEAVRIYAIPPGERGPARARPKRVRVHTAEGWAEARLADEDGLWHVLLGEPVLTRNVSVEIVEAHGDAPVHLAEVEVYGRSGTPREALVFDLARSVIAFDPPVWRKKLRTNTAGRAYIETVDVDGRLQRLLPGSALVGRTGDRMLLVERASWSTCGDHQGTYDLLDTHTRVLVPLGDMGGFAGDVFRHTKGLGFAVGVVEGYEAKLQAVVLDEGDYERRVTGRLDEREPKELLTDWGMESTRLRHDDAHPPSEPPEGCAPATRQALDSLKPHLPKRTTLDAKQWLACSLGHGAQLLVSTSGPCGKQWHVVVLDGDGDLGGQRSGKESGTHARLRRIDDASVLVELWGSDDQPRLLLAEGGSLAEVGTVSALSLRPPAPCRKRCDVGFEDLGPGS